MFTDETSRTRVPQRKAHDELVTIYQQILHSEVSQPLSPEQLVN